MKADIIHEADLKLGEGPVWVDGAFYCVDIENKRLHRFGDDASPSQTWDSVGRLGAAVPTVDGRFVLCEEDGLAVLDLGSGERTELTRHLPDENLRHNDCKADPQGRLWLGTMSFDGEPTAALSRRGVDGQIVEQVGGVTIGNGLAWRVTGEGSRGGLFYYIDTPTKRVDAFDYNPALGTITGRRPLWEADDGDGSPDGMTIDAEGNLWVAFWGGSCVRCLSPAGKVIETVDVPTPQVTSCCFGGDDLKTLYITTASFEGPKEAGSVFACRPGVAGLPVDRVKP